MRCSIVIPVHNKASLTRRCLMALLATPASTVETDLIVVDDGSTDWTASLLTAFGDRLQVVRNAECRGFAAACNAGARAARGESLVFLNNDILPVAGWLDALVATAATHPSAGVIGAKLLYPDDTIQHAGVVFSQMGNPYHCYRGFNRHHAAVNMTRPFTAVTGACVLLRADVFWSVAGFDEAYLNGYEDVDLCLRLARAGYTSVFCHEAELYHLESASRGRTAPVADNLRLFKQRWADTIQPDDLDLYIRDGLIRLQYAATTPLVLHVAPELALVHQVGAASEALTLAQQQTYRSASLLDMVLQAALAEAESAEAAALERRAPVDRLPVLERWLGALP